MTTYTHITYNRKALSAFFCIHKLPDVHDWQLTVIDKGERSCHPSHPESTAIFALLDSSPRMAVALSGLELTICGQQGKCVSVVPLESLTCCWCLLHSPTKYETRFVHSLGHGENMWQFYTDSKLSSGLYQWCHPCQPLTVFQVSLWQDMIPLHVM